MTYSIIARDKQTGRFGLAVQTRWFAVGRIVGWTQCGVGVVATQSFVDPSYGPNGLDLMAQGSTASAALRKLVAADAMRVTRQVAMIDNAGRSSAHTGAGCVKYSKHLKQPNLSAQANMMLNDGVPEAMTSAYLSHSGDFADRLMAALRAAEAKGGDIRGRQSAALFVTGGPEAPPWQKEVDIRVDDHKSPLDELQRLLTVSRGYDLLGSVRENVEADESARAAVRLLPKDDQIAAFIASSVKSDGWSKQLEQRALRSNPNWTEFFKRIDKARKSWPKQ